MTPEELTIKDFLAQFLMQFSRFQKHYLRLNKKPVNAEKLKNILLNNYPQNTRIRIEYKLQVKPFYTGDYLYFRWNYGSKGFNRLQNRRLYITILNERTL